MDPAAPPAPPLPNVKEFMSAAITRLETKNQTLRRLMCVTVGVGDNKVLIFDCPRLNHPTPEQIPPHPTKQEYLITTLDGFKLLQLDDPGEAGVQVQQQLGELIKSLRVKDRAPQAGEGFTLADHQLVVGGAGLQLSLRESEVKINDQVEPGLHFVSVVNPAVVLEIIRLNVTHSQQLIEEERRRQEELRQKVLAQMAIVDSLDEVLL